MSIDDKQAKAISKYLSYLLRHDPAEAGITLDAQGWTPVDLLIEGVQHRFPELDRTMLEYIVATNSKQRFAFNNDRTMIRASQGHSVPVQLNYNAQEPPMVLFHGTSRSNVESILRDGIKKGERHDVHLSENVTTALQVGSRHGHGTILKIHALKMYEDGYVFYLSANRVWLTEYVPPKYVEVDF